MKDVAVLLMILISLFIVPASDASQSVISQYRAMWTSPPTKVPNNVSVDAPLLGNGDMLACVGGTPDQLSYYLTKNDFWQLRHSGGRPSYFGQLTIQMDDLKEASFRMEQPLYEAETHGAFAYAEGKVCLRSFVAATENMLLVTLTAQGKPVQVNVDLAIAEGSGEEIQSGRDNGIMWGVRRFEKGMDIPTACAAALKLYNAESNEFTLKPGQPVTLAVVMQSRFNNSNYLEDAKIKVRTLSIDDVTEAHRQWWQTYWSQSFVEIGDPVIEKQYYLSHYVMGSASRDRTFPPNIFGWVTHDDPGWFGDYHMNYNHMAPFYGLYTSNHLEQAMSYHAPILAVMERCRWYAKNITGCRGVMVPVGIGPLGIETTRDSSFNPPDKQKGGLFWRQKSNSAYCVVNMSMHWYHSYDLDYAREVYPFINEVALFWEDYLKFEEDRYVIYRDAVHEGSGWNVNSICSLGLVRNVFETILDMSRELKIDAHRHEKWRHILDHLSSYSFQEKDDKTVFRYTDKGPAWWKNNTLGIQHIYPAGAIGLDSDPQLIEVARNTISVMQRWLDRNGTNSYFPAAVRVGYDAEEILKNLIPCAKHTYPNGFQLNNPHGVENCSTVPNTINEMLCMGHGHVVRLFPVWPRHRDARFHSLRTWGAFLVSSKLTKGDVQYVQITSEQGRDCRMVNPWPDQAVRAYRNGRKAECLEGERFTFKTAVGETILLGPDTLCVHKLKDRLGL